MQRETERREEDVHELDPRAWNLPAPRPHLTSVLQSAAAADGSPGTASASEPAA